MKLKIPKPKFSLGRKAKTGFLVLDIGTEAVKVLIFDSTNDGIEVKGYVREPHNAGDVERSTITDVASLITTASRAVSRAERESRIVSREIILAMGGDFLDALPVVFQERRNNPKLRINEVELKNIFRKMYAQSLEKLRAYFLQEGLGSSHDIKIVDAYIQDIKIDGYEVADPLDLDGKVVQLNVFYSFLFPSFREILETLSTALKKHIREIYAPSFSVSAVIRKDFVPLSDFITVDIGGTTTEISLTRKGIVAGTKHFQLGGRAITQRISQDLGIGFWEAEEIKEAYTAKKLSSYVSKKIKEIVARDVDLWKSGLGLSFKEISFLNILPADIFVYGGASAFSDFGEVTRSTDWYSSLPFSGKPSITFLRPDSLKGVLMSDSVKAFSSSYDIVPFVAARIFRDRMARSHLQEMFENIINVMEK